jgi:hypothetical protein
MGHPMISSESAKTGQDKKRAKARSNFAVKVYNMI